VKSEGRRVKGERVSARVWSRSRWLRTAAVALALGASTLSLAWLVPLPARLSQPPSTVVAYADGTPAFVFLSPDDRYRMAATADGVDPDYLRALLRFEDKRFYRHPGIDPLAIARAAWMNARAGRVISGGSTLTLQLVRVLEPRPRTLRSKVVEAARALQLELRLGKDELLAAYLTFVPFGRNVEGVSAASWAYFGHGPAQLSAAEIATLLVVPQSPSARYPRPANVERLRAARDRVAAWLAEKDALPRDDDRKDARSFAAADLLDSIAREPVPAGLRPLPRAAPHFAFWLRARHPGVLRLETTLDRGLQELVEREMRTAGRDLERLGIHNGAAVLLDHRTGALVAAAGGFDFWAGGPAGQIPAFDVARSPGSALKPFLYAAAIKRGLALPEHLVEDTPVRYADYAPQNYDGEFAGLVTLEDALSHSLNVPFVRLLGELRVESFLDELRAAGAAHLRAEPGHYGLSAAIGAIEITPIELAGLYGALAADGRYTRVRWLAAESSAPAAWLSPGAAHLTRRALARRDRPDFPERRRFSQVPRDIFWKTGTSYGHRDAWAAGSSADITAAVWLGNLDNKPAADLVGADAAGPILFDLLEAAATRASAAPPRAFPRDLKTVEVCAYSGLVPGAACPARRGVLAVASHVPTATCRFHAAVDVDLATGLALNPSCRGGKSFETRSFLVYPASLRRFLRSESKLLSEAPPLHPDCQARGARDRIAMLRILSPQSDQTLFLLPGVPPTSQEVPFQVDADGGARSVSWFVSGRFLGEAAPTDSLWWTPERGEHEITAVDDRGRTARTTLRVRERAAPGVTPAALR
jgi:penicillin-binding protein 1C